MANVNVGLSDESIKILTQGFQNILAPNQKIQVYVFGSRARGDQKKYSDIDLLIVGTPQINDQKFQVLEDFFEESDLPIKVDLVRKEDLVESFKASVEQDKKLFLSFPHRT